MSERHTTTTNYFFPGITVSALLHIGVFYLCTLFLEQKSEYNIEQNYGLENMLTSSKSNDITSQKNNLPNDTKENQRQMLQMQNLKVMR